MKILIISGDDRTMGPMAGALLRERNIPAVTAGLEAIPGRPAAPKAIQAMWARHRLDLSGHRSRRFERHLAEDAELILCMTAADAWRVRTLYPEYRDRLSLFFGYADGLKGVYYDLPHHQAPPQELSHYMVCAEALAQAVDKIILHLQRNERKEPTL